MKIYSAMNASKKLHLTVVGALVAFSSMVQAQTSPWAESYRLEVAGKYAEAQAQIDPIASELAVLRSAWLMALQGRFVDAEKRYLQTLDMNPKSIPALVGVMSQQMAQLRYVDTIATGQRVLKLSAMDYTAQTNIMFCLWRMSAWADLAKQAAEVSPYYPNDVAVLVYRARAESALGNKKAARDLYARVIDLFPGHIEASNYVKGPL